MQRSVKLLILQKNAALVIVLMLLNRVVQY
ncbi:UNVERIFIED_CONTAM: hypothetical protein GTU68_040619 [Idotea baltica]|nr:hypothetical protein [Idotea baltica]